VRHRSEKCPLSNPNVGILEKSGKMWRQGILVFYPWKAGMGVAT